MVFRRVIRHPDLTWLPLLKTYRPDEVTRCRESKLRKLSDFRTKQPVLSVNMCSFCF